MGQIFLPENIPSLIRANSTQITFAALNNAQTTRLNIGGQQYALSSTLTLSSGSTGANGLDTGALAAIQLWYVYAIAHQTTFAVALVASLASPATGPSMPSGYGTAFKLVGAFYTDGASTIGSIVSGALGGTVSTDSMSFTPTGSWTSNVTYSGMFSRKGEFAEFQMKVLCTATPGSGILDFNIPGGLTIDTAKLLSSLQDNGNFMYGVNESRIRDISAGDGYLGHLALQSTTSVRCRYWGTNPPGIATANDTTPTTPMAFAVNDFVSISVKIPIVGWKPTLF